MKILIVDDEPDILALYEAVLRDEGYDVQTAPDGAQGVVLARQQLPDAVLLDLKMPVMDGKEALRRLKDDPATARIRTAFLTAFTDPRDARTGLESEGVVPDAIIKKGDDLRSFVQQVAALTA